MVLSRALCLLSATVAAAACGAYEARAIEIPQNAAQAAPADPQLYAAVDQLTAYFANDLTTLSNVARKTAIVNFTQSESLPESLQAYVLKRLEYVSLAAKSPNPVRFVQCQECLTVHAEAKGDEIFLKQGITDDAELKAVMKRLSIRNYSEVNLAFTGKQLVMNMSVYDDNKLVVWSNQYQTALKKGKGSDWTAGVFGELAKFSGDLPAASAGRAFLGQRITGYGNVGIAATLFRSTPQLQKMSSFGAFVELNHNEFFATSSDLWQLYYTAEVGFTDFNGNQQPYESLGLRGRLGSHFSALAAYRIHQFPNAPKDNRPVYNTGGAPVLSNNEALPPHFLLGFGAEVL